MGTKIHRAKESKDTIRMTNLEGPYFKISENDQNGKRKGNNAKNVQ